VDFRWFVLFNRLGALLLNIERLVEVLTNDVRVNWLLVVGDGDTLDPWGYISLVDVENCLLEVDAFVVPTSVGSLALVGGGQGDRDGGGCGELFLLACQVGLDRMAAVVLQGLLSLHLWRSIPTS
jgi:hypothetical protein